MFGLKIQIVMANDPSCERRSCGLKLK